MNQYSRFFSSKEQFARQMQCIVVYLLPAGMALWLSSGLSAINPVLFQATLLFTGWLSWTFVEYIAHRFWMHGPRSGELFNHLHHHSHPTEINVTTLQRVLLVTSCMALQYTSYRLQNYFTLFSGFYAGFVGYFFVHALLHKKWFGRICPRLQRFHILHHCKLPHHCFGVTVHWWDYVFNTTPPKKFSPSSRIVHFYFSGRKQVSSLILFALLASSCNHYYYGPNTANIPILKEKNEGKLNFNYYVTDEASGIEFQSAYAVGKNTAVMLNILNASEGGNFFRWKRSESEITGSGNYAEVAAGYFSPLQPTKWVFETYAGIGIGRVRNAYDFEQKSKVGITKIFVQPSFGYASERFEIGFSARLAYVWLNVKNSTVTEAKNFEDYHDIEYIRNNRSAILIEPGFVARLGQRGLKFTFNYTHSANPYFGWKQEEAGFSFGVCLPFKVVPER